MKSKKQLLITPLEDFDPDIGSYLWMLQDTRRRTLSLLKNMTDEIINWIPPQQNNIGTLLYHLAAIEISWLYEDILEGVEFVPEISARMKYNVREEDGNLIPISHESLETHLERLQFCRDHLLSKLKGMTLDDFRRPRLFEKYETTPEWVIHHLMQHEAEHRGQIGEIQILAQKALGI